MSDQHLSRAMLAAGLAGDEADIVCRVIEAMRAFLFGDETCAPLAHRGKLAFTALAVACAERVVAERSTIAEAAE